MSRTDSETDGSEGVSAVRDSTEADCRSWRRRMREVEWPRWRRLMRGVRWEGPSLATADAGGPMGGAELGCVGWGRSDGMA